MVLVIAEKIKVKVVGRAGLVRAGCFFGDIVWEMGALEVHVEEDGFVWIALFEVFKRTGGDQSIIDLGFDADIQAQLIL